MASICWLASHTIEELFVLCLWRFGPQLRLLGRQQADNMCWLCQSSRGLLSSHLGPVCMFVCSQVAVKRLRVLDLDDLRAPNEQYGADGSGNSSQSNGGSQPAMGASQAAFQQFFEREIAILASIRHPNVVNFIGKLWLGHGLQAPAC